MAHRKGTKVAEQSATESAPQVGEAQKQVYLAKRLLKVKRARTSLQAYIELCNPDPEDPENPDKSRYVCEPHHKLLIEIIERVVKGDDPRKFNKNVKRLMRVALSMPPQHGKSTVISRYGVAWAAGNHPHWHIIVGTYAASLAQRAGEEVRDILRSQQHQAVFPACKLRSDSQSKTEMKTIAGGTLTFVGRGEGTTGLPCNMFVIDDPYKDHKEADSPVVREDCWRWYSGVVFSRCTVMTPIVIVHTRWHFDDLIGRLCDPAHENYDAKKARRWTYINIPAIMDNKEVAELLGKQIGDALWPDRFPIPHLEEARENDKRVFSALYMGRPSPEEGDYFKVHMIRTYESMDDLPENLRMYAASDHALTKKQTNDENCLGCVGVDEDSNVWVMPDLFFARAETDAVVEEMLQQIKRHKPIVWWAARDHISQSIGPFLRRRMLEEQTYAYIEESPEVADPIRRGRSIQGRMAMGKIYFPAFASWWPKAKDQVLKFPNGSHDDFVSFISHIGMGLEKVTKARPREESNDNGPKFGTLAWVKQSSNERSAAERRFKLVGGR
jgi:phage terminase large subunit-like protein